MKWELLRDDEGRTGPANMALDQALLEDARESGRDLSQIDFYIAFSHWKLACILQGVMVRAEAGAQGERAANLEPLRQRIEMSVALAEEHATTA